MSMAVGLAASAISLFIGIAYGAVAGYLGGRTDHVMMRVIEVLSGLRWCCFVIFLTVVFGAALRCCFLHHRRGGLAVHGAHRPRADP